MSNADDGEMWVDGFELHGKGIVRTEEKCSECSKLIVAKINFDVNGNYRIACPHCGHLHCRVIKDGKIVLWRDYSYPGAEQIVGPLITPP